MNTSDQSKGGAATVGAHPEEGLGSLYHGGAHAADFDDDVALAEIELSSPEDGAAARTAAARSASGSTTAYGALDVEVDIPPIGESSFPLNGQGPGTDDLEATADFGRAAERTARQLGLDHAAQADVLEALDDAPPALEEPARAPAASPDASASAGDDDTGLPLIGKRPVTYQQRVLATLAAIGSIGLLVMVPWSLVVADQHANEVAATGQALMQSQRLAKSVSQAMVGSPAAFPEVKESGSVLAQSVRGLAHGNDMVHAVPAAVGETVAPLMGLVDRAEKSANVVIEQQKTLTQVGEALHNINRQSSELLDTAETVSSLKLQSDASASELSAVGQLVMLTQRIGKSANEFLTFEGVSPEAVFLLGKDLNTFREIADGLLDGNPDLRLPGTKDAATRERLKQLIGQYEQTRKQSGTILSNLQGLVAAREAQAQIVSDSEPLRKGLETVQASLQANGGIPVPFIAGMVAATLALLLGVSGFFKLYLRSKDQRTVLADQQRLNAERLEREAQRVNDANQAAILRLMNELQAVAEGDLTQQATVTEDITGAIADSVNYTVEELRSIVSQVQGTAGRVTETTSQVEATSTELLAASTEQLHEIRETGESVLHMASRINEVSARAQATMSTAQQSLEVTRTGREAVQNAIEGMNSIRDQIQDTSKRIKRLGESSQEIGEITELISDITEQTNVLALNAAIQAASAGEAGRGFSVVAEEVQRLAERSGDATRQISALVKAIQTDTGDAVAAMERSTQGVVRGAQLSDAAGTALVDIDRVTRELSRLVEEISERAQREAQSANVVAANIQHIFAVTEQTGDGTRSTAHIVRELSRSAEELRQSVSRFKIV